MNARRIPLCASLVNTGIIDIQNLIQSSSREVGALSTVRVRAASMSDAATAAERGEPSEAADAAEAGGSGRGEEHPPKREHQNCAVEGCTNTTRNTELTFFPLPHDFDRRNKWLKLMDREDLMVNLNPSDERICEIHFTKGCILQSPEGKVLKKTAFPRLHLYREYFSDKRVQTNDADIKDVSTQTGITKEDCPALSKLRQYAETRKVMADCVACKKRKEAGDTGRNQFLKLCDIFLAPDLAETVKEQASTFDLLDDFY